MDDAALNYNVAVCYYKLGRFADAAQQFEDVAARFAGLRALADYNLGLSLTRLNRTGEARAAFERARTSDDPKIASLAQAMLARIAPAAPAQAYAPQWTGLFELNAGHDDNVALIEESTLPTGVSADSMLTEAFGFVSGRFGRSVAFDASAYAVDYADAGEFDQRTLRAAASYRWDFGSWRVDIGPELGYSTLGGSGFERQTGAALALRRAFSERLRFSLRLTHDRIAAAASQYSFVAGSRDRLRAGIEQDWGARRMTLYYELERNDRAAAGISPQRDALSLRYRQPLAGPWALDLSVWRRSSRYDELQPPRDEDLRQLTARLTRELPSGWFFSGEYLRADNDSSDASLAYGRNRFAVGVSKVF